MLSKNRLAAVLASAGIAMAMIPATAGAATVPGPSSTAALGAMTGGTVDTARKAGGAQQEYLPIDQPPTTDPTGGLVTILSTIASAIVSLVS